MHVGLFFGSFNPIHNGHLSIACYMLENTSLQEIWFVISPHNPFKNQQDLLPEIDRLKLVNHAVCDNPSLVPCDIEFSMPKPSYTIDTLEHLTRIYPQTKFSLIIGSDNLYKFEDWKNSNAIIAKYHRYIYPRPCTTVNDFESIKNATIVNAPMMNISSSQIRKLIAENEDVMPYLHKEVYKSIKENNFYVFGDDKLLKYNSMCNP
jgi:nicotinate-nucleotide adenylyltransferase